MTSSTVDRAVPQRAGDSEARLLKSLAIVVVNYGSHGLLERNLVSIGTSIGGVTMWRLSGAYRFGGDYRQAVVGVAIRYPGLFP